MSNPQVLNGLFHVRNTHLNPKMVSPGKRRQLIFLWPYTNWGGAQIYFFSIMKAAGHEWDILVLLPKDSRSDLLAFLDQLDVKYEFLDRSFDPQPEKTLAGKLKRQFDRVRSEFSILKGLKGLPLGAGILHIDIAPWQSWILLSILAMRGANLFVTVHNLPPRAPRWRELIWTMRLQILSRLRGFHIFASNEHTKKALFGRVTKAFWEDIRVTYTCVDPIQIDTALASTFDRDAIRSRFAIPPDAFVVLAVGQFVDRKGRWVFLEAAKRVYESFPDTHFVWLTPREPDSNDLARVDSFNLGSHFQLILSDSVGNDRVSILKFFRIGDIFALPSYVEGLPIALLEAMALGIPSVSTNVYAIPEALRHLETGILTEPGDSSGLADAVALLREDPELYSRVSIDGRQFVMEKFDERIAAARCVESYFSCFDN